MINHHQIFQQLLHKLKIKQIVPLSVFNPSLTNL